ncbi:unnamed protein product [Moneuplotes crassus]|uniref:Uncharacterized protein n=1 Tax=Euplotes crassus TaxID=5936 RepID=A0AAD1XJM5_EUPCR|nr:unnamed protein product [Moneuplotes crassus]
MPIDSKPYLRHASGNESQRKGSMTMTLKDSGGKGKYTLSLEKERGSYGKKIGLFHEAPEHNKYLIYIKTGYRIGYTSFKDCFKSIFSIHNETVNIWTHLVGIFMYIFLSYYVCYLMPTTEELRNFDGSQGALVRYHKYFVEKILGYNVEHLREENSEVFPLILHYLGGVICMACSTSHHVFMCHSEKVFHFFYKCDSFGILFLALGMNFTMNFYIFYCEQTFYIAYIYIGLANLNSLLIAILTFHPKFNQTKYRALRVWLFIIFGVICCIAIFHSLFITDPLYSYGAAPWWFSGNIISIFGSYIYVKKVPEKWYPCTFDHCGQSHNIWHLLIMVASGIHCIASLSMHYARMDRVCPDCT